MKIQSDATKGLILGVVETLKSTGQIFPSAGPFQVDVTDPAGAIAVVPGTPDQKTPTIFRPNGTGKTGTVTVTVTDTANKLAGTASFDVVAPPVQLPDTLTVSFTPEP